MMRRSFFLEAAGIYDNPQIGHFIVKTDNSGTSASNQFTIPTNGAGYDYNIYTDDGQSILNRTGDYTITFPSPGTYKVAITGSFPKFFFNNSGDKLKIIEIPKFGTNNSFILNGGTYGSMFFGCSNIAYMPTDASRWINNATTLPSCFRGMGNLYFQNASILTFANVTGFFSCFQSTTLPTADYSNILINLNTYNLFTGTNFHGGNSKYNSSAVSSRANLISSRSWSITDGGYEP